MRSLTINVNPLAVTVAAAVQPRQRSSGFGKSLNNDTDTFFFGRRPEPQCRGDSGTSILEQHSARGSQGYPAMDSVLNLKFQLGRGQACDS